MPRRDVSTPAGEKGLPYLSQGLGVGTTSRRAPEAPRRLALYAIMAILGAFTLAGCYISRTIDQATASDVNNQSFTFASGAVFHAALVNVSTTLAFSNNATNFTLSSAGGTATGSNRFGSCILTVTGSTYSSTTTGPQAGEVIKLDPCDFDSDNHTLTVVNRGITATSTVATSTSTGGGGNVHAATATDVNNRSFTFADGGVFHAALTNVATALAFSNNAANFTLSSAGRGTATGSNRFGSCILTVASSDYSPGTGPQVGDVLTLNPCNFDSTTTTLTISNRGVMVTSAAGTVVVP